MRPYDIGLVASAYALRKQADELGDATFIRRAEDIQQQLETWWYPSLLIRSHELSLGGDMGAQTGHYVLFEDVPDATVESPSDEAFHSGDTSAQLSAFGSDFASSLSDAAKAAASAVSPLLPAFMVVVAVLLLLLLVERRA